MNLHLTPTQTLSLKQRLSPKLIQALKTLQLPYGQLIHDIEDLVSDNVFLELERPFLPATLSSASLTSSPSSADVAALAEDVQTVSLYDHLMAQLNLLSLEATAYACCTTLIEHLDSRGYLPDYPAIRDALAEKFKISPRKIGDYLTIVQSLEPEGVGARTLKECLLLQIDRHEHQDPEFKALLTDVVRDDLEALAAENFTLFESDYGLSEEAVEGLLLYLKENLTPYPGAAFSSAATATPITPSFEVYVEGNQPKIRCLEVSQGPQIKLSSDYEAILKDPALDEAARTFLRAQQDKAQLWIETLQKRGALLERFGHYLAAKQTLFLSKGPDFLVPLLQKDIAADLEVSASTISRLVHAKYIRTPFGVLPLSALCPRNYFGHTQAVFTRYVQELAAQFPQDSDAQLAQKLQDLGIPIARRTVCKYRKHALTN